MILLLKKRRYVTSAEKKKSDITQDRNLRNILSCINLYFIYLLTIYYIFRVTAFNHIIKCKIFF